ncbi:MAG TPA: ATP-binding protein [Symbiobacteriaceae bacterium]|jgi:two-component system sensor histidine kinase DctS
MRQYQQALEYIYATTEQQEEAVRFMARRIKDYRVSGLLLGKVIRGRELGIDLQVDRRSRLDAIPRPLDGSDLVVIAGNLIENAMEALAGQSGERRVECLLQSDALGLLIRVTDNGPGVPAELHEQIFVQGFSTKGEQRGLGLALIQQLVSLAGGRVDWQPCGSCGAMAFPAM